MFISKRKFDEALHRAKMEVAEQWERKMCEVEKNMWQDQEKNREREDHYRRFEAIEKRIHALEKEVGIVNDIPRCPCMVEPKY